MSQANDLPASEQLQPILVEIFEKWSKLINFYLMNGLNEIPIELLQLEHSFNLCCDLVKEAQNNPNHFFDFYLQAAQKTNQIMVQSFQCWLDALQNNCHASSSNKPDKRFQHPLWQQNCTLQLMQNYYQAMSKLLYQKTDQFQYMDDKTKAQIQLYVHNLIDALSPSNQPTVNPDIWQSLMASNGFSFLQGLNNLLGDLLDNHGYLNIKMTPKDAFTVGKDLATTPGKVVYQNTLMQLIQYSPTTNKVDKTPILITPPWINKYYILDLTPEKSLVKWLVDQGFTVFMISWVNPDHEYIDTSFEDYMNLGPLAALEVICKELKAPNVHMVGYCIGGTLLGCTLAYMQAKKDKRAKSGTYFTSLLDFTNPGELGIFIDELQLQGLEKLMQTKGYLDGRFIDTAFNLLRPNDLIWPYYINNYCEGKQPKAFDLLYWNSDSTNLPASMHAFYLRNMYLENNLIKKQIILNETTIDLNTIKLPVFFISTERDHITPWKSTYAGMLQHKGTKTFVLAGAGHIAGIVNPPITEKYYYRTNMQNPNLADDWYKSSQQNQGSWWPFWVDWLRKIDSTQVARRDLKQTMGQPLEDAPGSYVMKRL